MGAKKIRSVFMMIVFVMLFVCIMNIHKVSAIEFDNVKSYDANTRTITVKNLFGIGGKISETKLLTPINFKVASGYNKVAEFQIKFYSDYSNFLKELELYDRKNNDAKISRTYDYKYKIVKDVVVDDYTEVCGLSENLTNICQVKKTGSHHEQKEEWIPLSQTEIKKGDILDVGIFTDVYPGDYVEWIPNIFGVRVEEWAIWTSDLNIGLEGYYKLDEINSENEFVESVSGYNLTAIQMGSDQMLSGIINKSANFTNASQRGYGDVSNVYKVTNIGNSFSISTWINTNRTDTDQLIAIMNSNWALRLVGDDIYFNGVSSGVSWINNIFTANLISTNTWEHIVITYNGTGCSGFSIYLDGDSQGVDSCSNFIAWGGGGDGTFRIGSDNDTDDYNGQFFKGKIDELGIWNRSLTATEVTQLYNGSYGITYQSNPDHFPIVTLQSPQNNSNYTTAPQTIDFICYGSDDMNFTEMEFYLNGTLTQTNSSGFNNSNYTFTEIINDDGDYNWSCTGNDNNSQQTNSEVWYFTIDTTPPVVSNDNITDLVVYSLPANLIWNYSASDTHLDSCYYNTSENSAYTIVTCNSPISTSFSVEGNKTIQYCANDTLGLETCNIAYSYLTLVNVSQADNPDPVGEGVTVTFNLSLNSTSIPTTTATLNLNGELYTPTTIVAGTNGYYFERDVVVPLGWGSDTGTNVSWFWNYTMSGVVTNASTPSENLTVYSLVADNCSSYTDVILNFTLKDEGTDSILDPPTTNNTEIQLDLQITSLDNSSLVYSFSNTWVNMTNGNAQVCVPSNLLSGGSNYRIDFISSYIADNHVEEFYYLDNGILNSSSYFNAWTNRNITLYDLLLTDSTTFLFSFFDENNLIVPNAIVHLFRYYIGDGLFREVERGQQDDNGETHLHLLEEDAVYYFVVTLDSELLYTSSQYNAKCQEVPCVIQLYGSSEVNPFSEDFDGLPEGTYSVTGNRTTRNVTLSFNLNETKTMNLTVYQLFGNSSDSDILIGTDSLGASSGSIVIHVPELYGNITYYAVVYSEGSIIGSEFIDLSPRANDIFPDGFGVFLAFLVIITLGLAGATQGVWSMIFLVLGFIITSMIKLLDMNYTALIFLICLVALLIYKLMERKG